MIRFVDLTEPYWTDPEGGSPRCAFLDTVTDTFIANIMSCAFDGTDDLDAIESPELRERCRALVPDGFFEGTYHRRLEAERAVVAIEAARAPALRAAAKAALDLSWRAMDAGIDPTVDTGLLLDLYRLARRYDGGGNLAVDARITPRRPWSAGATLDAEQAIERVESTFHALLTGQAVLQPKDRTWAVIEAVRRWGPEAGVETHEGFCRVGRWDPYPHLVVEGEGPTWEAALAAADEAKRKAAAAP